MTKDLPEDLILAAYQGEVPCIFQLIDGCMTKAEFLLVIRHIDDDSPMCGIPGKPPACLPHKERCVATMQGFWADIAGGLPPCLECGRAVRLDGVEAP